MVSANDLNVRVIAQLCHEANAAYCRSQGDFSHKSWEAAPEYQHKIAIAGVYFHLANPNAGAGESHQRWYEHKLADGWSYGPEKNDDTKQHPFMVPFTELPFAEQVKEHIFKACVAAMFVMHGGMD